MSTKWKRIGLGGLLAALAIGTAAVADAGEKKLVYGKSARQTVMEARMGAGGIPDRELVQSVYIDTLKSTDPEFDGVEERIYGQDENFGDGNGRHRGYAIDFLNSGDQLFQRYEGTHKVVVKDGGAWEATYQGRSQIVGGTGKYKNARGWIDYKGRVSPEGITEEDDVAIEY